MAKETIYESAKPTRSITTGNGLLKFVPGGEDQANGIPIGECNIAQKTVQSQLKASEAELRDLIQKHDDYTEDPKLIGVRGIWPQHLRLSVKRKAEADLSRKDAFNGLDDAALEAILKSKGVKAPKNSDHQTLVDLCMKAYEVGEPAEPVAVATVAG